MVIATKRFVAYGPGFSADFDTLQEASEVVARNRCGEVYVPYAEVERWRRIAGTSNSQRAANAESEAEQLRTALGAIAGYATDAVDRADAVMMILAAREALEKTK